MLSKERKIKLEKNIWKFYLYRVFCSLVFIIPVWVLFLQDNGMSMTQVMIIQSIYTATVMLAVVPAGILGDFIGRKKVLIVNAVFMVAGFALYYFSRSFMMFLAAEITLALSTAAWSASRNAFFYDTLKELGKEESFKKLYGKVVAINNITFAIAALIGGYIATYSLRLPFVFTIIPSAIALFITFSFTDTKNYKHGDRRYIKHLKDACSFAAKHPKLRFFLIYSAIAWGIISVAFVLFQPYFQSIKLPLAMFGLVYAAMGGATAIGGKYSHWIEQKLGEKKILILIAVGLLLSFLGMGKIGVILGIIFPIFISFIEGVLDPAITDYIHKHVESHHRATLSSLVSITIQGSSAVLAPFFGWMVDAYTLQAAMIVAAFIMFVNIFILSLVYVIGWRRLRNET